MDYSNKLKSLLEKNNLIELLKELNLDKETIFNLGKSSPNIVCSNSSYLFVYLEQAAAFLAISLNRLCKSLDEQFIKSLQRLSLNSAPIGKFKKCLINPNGTYILLVYDKSLTCVELPSKWGKHDQFDDGKLNIICKTIKINLNKNIDIIDAIWHLKSDDDWVTCLTSDNNLRFFRVSNPNVLLKEFHFNNINIEPNSNEPNTIYNFINIDMGPKFEYNDKFAYPFYILKSNGQIESLIEYESSKNFDYLGSLALVPYSMYNDENKIVSFMCLKSRPNCLIILLNNGLIYHCIFINNLNSFGVNDTDENAELNTEEILFIYESIKLEGADYSTIKFVQDHSNSSRYFAYHSTGLHSVYLPWLENLQLIYDQDIKKTDLNEFDESKLCQIDHLISTKPFEHKNSLNFLVGATMIYNFGKTNRILVVLDNQLNFICLNMEIAALSERLKVLFQLESQKSNDITCEQSEDLFTNYIISLLKRNSNMPFIKCKIENDLDENELKLLIKNTINMIKHEYIEKQKNVILEFQKRCKFLKQQEKLQFETMKEINSKLEQIKNNKQTLVKKYEDLITKQTNLESSIENILARLYEKSSVPIGQNEKKIFRELKTIKENLKDFNEQIINQKQNMSQKQTLKKEIFDNIKLDEREKTQVKSLLKNESEKIKDLIQKVELLKQTLNN